MWHQHPEGIKALICIEAINAPLLMVTIFQYCTFACSLKIVKLVLHYRTKHLDHFNTLQRQGPNLIIHST